MRLRADLSEQMFGQRRALAAAVLEIGQFGPTAAVRGAAPVGLESGVARRRIGIERAGVDIERSVLDPGAVHQGRGVALTAFRRRHIPAFARHFADLEQGVGLQRLADMGFEFEVGERQ